MFPYNFDTEDVYCKLWAYGQTRLRDEQRQLLELYFNHAKLSLDP